MVEFRKSVGRIERSEGPPFCEEFLIYKGIRGKPADKRVQIVLTYIGLAFILGLMVWVIGLDFGLISRR